MLVIYIPTPSHCQKAIKKLNSIIITQCMMIRRPNILRDTLRFDISANWKMLREEFEIWLADPLFNIILIIVGMYVTNLGYLEDGSPYFTEFSDSGTEESIRY